MLISFAIQPEKTPSPKPLNGRKSAAAASNAHNLNILEARRDSMVLVPAAEAVAPATATYSPSSMNAAIAVDASLLADMVRTNYQCIAIYITVVDKPCLCKYVIVQ